MTQTDPVHAQFGFCTISGRFDNNPQFQSGSFASLRAHLDSHLRVIPVTLAQFDALDRDGQANHKSGPSVILAEFKRPGTRDDADVACTYALGLDVDEAHVELEELRRLLAGTSAIVYESSRSVPSARRWRVFIEYARPCLPEEHERAFYHWHKIIPGVCESVRNPGRLWYAVQRFKGSEQRIIETLQGAPFDPGSVMPISSREALLRHIKPPADEPASGGNRNNQLSRYAASVIRDCASEPDLLEALLDMNSTYEPPLPVKEVRQMARSKWKVRAKFGWTPITPAGSPDDPPTESDDAPGFDANELLDFTAGEVPWIVQDVLTYGAHLLVGRPKGGKSWITLDMAYAVANGGEFLGKKATKAGVLWISAEDTKASLSRRLKVRGERFSLAPVVMTSESLKAERARWEDCSFDQWLRGFLQAHPSIRLVVMDTHATIEALWAHEAIDEKRNASIVAQAYQMSRIYEDIGQETETCIVLVHHAAKRKGKDIIDYHELINLPATVVAGSTASMVLADPPDRDIHEEDDHRRVFAVRGRHIIGEAPLLIELKDARATLLGEYHEIKQSETQAEVFEAIEAILLEQESTTIAEVAAALGKHKNTVQGLLKRAGKKPGGLNWKGRTLEVRQRTGIRWKQ